MWAIFGIIILAMIISRFPGQIALSASVLVGAFLMIFTYVKVAMWERKKQYLAYEEEALRDMANEESAQQTQEKLERGITPIEFEQHIAAIFEAYGYRVFPTARTGDHGIDLKLFKGQEYSIVQCKLRSGPIGEPTVRDLFGTLTHEKADFAYLVTNSRFTDAAWKWANGKRVLLMDSEWLNLARNETGTYSEVNGT